MQDSSLQLPPLPPVAPAPQAVPASSEKALPIEGLVGRTVTLAAASGLVLVALFVRISPNAALGALAGLVLNLLGLYTLGKLMPMVLRPLDAEAVDRKAVVKYALGHLLSLTAIFPLLFVVNTKGFLAGYSYPLVILLLKAAGRFLFDGKTTPAPVMVADKAEAPAPAGTTKRVVGALVMLMLPLGLMAGVKARELRQPVMASVTHEANDEAAEAEGAEHAGAEEGAPAEGKHAAGGHKGAGHDGPPHVPTMFDWINSATGFKQAVWYTDLSVALGFQKDGKEVLSLEYLFWYFFTIGLLLLVAVSKLARPARIPTGFQALMENFLGFITDMVEGVIPGGKKYIPFIATLFLFILTMNYLGLVPGYNGPTAVLNTTAALAICVFCYAQYEGIRGNGIGAYLKHFLGEPLWMAPLMAPLHVVGEFIKPLSLSLRLFGNLTGEHILAAGFITLIAGISIGVDWFPLPLPVHAVLLPLALLVGFIQAMVFSLLSTIYIFLLLPHDDHGHGAQH